MRLMEKRKVDGNNWAQVCTQLRGNLKAEAMWSCLGQLASSSLNRVDRLRSSFSPQLENVSNALGITVLMPRAFKTFSSWGKKDDRVTFVQEVQTPGYTGVTNA